MSHGGGRGDGQDLDNLFYDIADEKFRRKLGLDVPDRDSLRTGSDLDFDEKDFKVAADGFSNKKDDNALPYSKARCIALVTTVCGASFSSVSTLCSAAGGWPGQRYQPI
jgi:hypothetical protein